MDGVWKIGLWVLIIGVEEVFSAVWIGMIEGAYEMMLFCSEALVKVGA